MLSLIRPVLLREGNQYKHMWVPRKFISIIIIIVTGGGFLTPCHEGEGEGEMVAWPS